MPAAADVLVAAATGALLSLALVPLCRGLARRLGTVAQPSADRWHRRDEPVPLLGGVAIAAAVGLGLLALGGLPPRPPVLLAGAAAMCLLGTIDDVRGLNASTRLIVQFVVASGFVFLGYGLHWTGSLTVDAVLTVVWIVGITNAFNLLDNMDGLCAGVAVIAGAALLAIRLGADPGPGAAGDVRYLALLVGAVGGFLVYNRSPASVFMGDAGSLLVGVSFAGLTLSPAAPAAAPAPQLALVAAATPVLVLLVPILDTVLVTSTRLLAARSALAGGRDHASHRLVALGLSERRAVAGLWALAAASGGIGWAATVVDASWSLLLMAASLLGALVLGVYLARAQPAGEPGAARSGDREPGAAAPAPPPAAAFAAVRPAAEVVLDFGLIAVAYYAAYRLRFEGPAFDTNFGYFLRSLPVVIACQLAALGIAGAYRPRWGHFSLIDTVTLLKAAVGGTLAAELIILYLYRFAGYSRTVFVIHGVLLLLALLATRLSFRLLGALVERSQRGGERLVVYGADESGHAALRELLPATGRRYRVVGFVDDDPGRRWRRVQGLPVLGDRRRLLQLVRAGDVEAVAVGPAQGAGPALDELRQACAAHGVRLLRARLVLEE